MVTIAATAGVETALVIGGAISAVVAILGWYAIARGAVRVTPIRPAGAPAPLVATARLVS